MSTVTATLLNRAPAFPLLLPDVPKPYPTPLPPNAGQPLGRLNARRNLRAEMEDLSDEEDEIEETWKGGISQRGFSFLHVIGKLYTQQEEKNDAETMSDESGSQHSGGAASNADDGENGSQGEDLDANMEDLDERNGTFDSEDGEGSEDDDDDLDNDLDDEDL